MFLIIITGGIGSGKSIVSRLVELMGYPTYDCDSMAKWLMNSSEQLKAKLIALLGKDTYDCDGRLNKAYVAGQIFANDQLRMQMNAIVHPAVKEHLQEWLASLDATIAFAETALPSESGLGNDAQAVWVVDAPVEVRVTRVMKRSAMTREQVLGRMASQAAEYEFAGALHIVNDNNHSLISQVSAALQQL